jgi:ribonuclease R
MRDFPSESEILRVFDQNPEKTFRLRELVVELGLRSSQARDLKHALKELSKYRKILYLKKGHFALSPSNRAASDRAHSHPRPRPHVASVPVSAARGHRRGLVSGRLIAHRGGYGFVVPDDPRISADIFIPPLGMSSALHGDRVDVHVIEKRPMPPRPGHFRHWSKAAQGRGRDQGLRLEGRIVNVTERAQKTVVGEFRCGARSNHVLPYDRHLPFEIIIPPGQEWPPEEPPLTASRHRQFGGESEAALPHSRSRRRGRANNAVELDRLIVDVELMSFPDPLHGVPPRGRVIEVLGRREDFGVDVEIIIRKYHLPHRFPDEVLAEAAKAPASVPESDSAGRRDFRHLPIVTIDGETAKDFDDAVFVERLANEHYRLDVHIADVAHYVRPGTALDREARLRGTSVYFPDRAVPMLPLELSNGICSLNQHVDRLTMSALMEIDREGQIVAYGLTPGVIRSAERMTYTAVHAVLSGDAAALDRYASLANHFRLMEELALILNRRRHARGSIDFDLPAPEIEFDEQGRMVGVTRSERNIAHRIIEEFMLAANETVARHLESSGAASVYRVHEPPDPKKVLEFEEIAAAFGQSLGIELPATHRQRVHAREQRDRHARFEQQIEAVTFKISSRHYQRLTERIAGKPEERILSYLMLRSLKQARYSEQNLGHFALASPTYTHFTSPIRRYPDLIVHRTLKALLAEQGGLAASSRVSAAFESPKTGGSHRHSPHAKESGSVPGCEGGVRMENAELQALGVETSESERRAADAERELMDWKKVVFMAERLGDEFDALVISLTQHGFFVELTELFVEGFIPLDTLHDDRYVYRGSLRAIVGLDSKFAYHLGNRLRVRLDRIDHVDNRLEFSVIEQSRGAED